MSEPTITCPNCRTEIKLTESLAAPLIESTRRDYEQRMAANNADVAAREAALRKREGSVDDQVAEKLGQERARIAADEAKKARLAIGADLEHKTRENAELHEVIQQRDAKLAEAQQQQAEYARKARELDDAKRELDLTVEKRIQEGLPAIREQIQREAEDKYSLPTREKDQTIASLQRKVEEMTRQIAQGSQQLQGEVLELELEAALRTRFPSDSIEPVPKGEHGGDVLHRVHGPLGQSCGTILWESKRTKNWSDGWLVKLREDQRAAKAEVAIIISQALPKDVETFQLIDGVLVAHPRLTLPLAVMLRQSLIELASARQAGEGQQTKMEMVYQYLTGPRFSQRVQAIVEAFSSMQEDLNSEKKAITRQWAKREEQIERVMQATVGMYGDLQGIAGKTLLEIEGLNLPALTDQRPE
jgi:hypothetical protein